MNKFLASAMVALLAFLPHKAQAESQVYNATDKTITIFWQASGCRRTQDSKTCSYTETFVCKRKELDPGKTADYEYKKWTADRMIRAVSCSGRQQTVVDSMTENIGDESRCVAQTAGNGSFEVTCGFSESEFEALSED